MRVVQDPVSPLFQTGRGVTTGNLFKSCQLAEYLLTQNLTLTVTLKQKRPDILNIFMRGKRREILSSLILFTLTLVPKKNTTVTLLSSQLHHKARSSNQRIFHTTIQ
jgi:hypothetical protein